MKTRVVVALVLLPLLAIAVLALPKIVTALLFCVMCAIAAYELLYRTGLVHHPRLVVYSVIMAFLVPLWCYFGRPYAWGILGLMVFLSVLFAEMMASHIKLQFEKVAYCILGGVLIPFLFSSIVRIHGMEVGNNIRWGNYTVVVPFLLAFSSDTGAYFAGSFFGKHKLAPVISPKKTVEGVAGGVLLAILVMLLYGAVMALVFRQNVNFLYAVIYGLLGSLGAVFGDLSFSVIKRQNGIKDYGNLIPGHGGILDRFDSMMIVGPLAEVLLLLLPIIG